MYTLVIESYSNHSLVYGRVISLLILLLYTAYFIAAMCYADRHNIFNEEPNLRLLGVTVFIYVAVLIYVFKNLLNKGMGYITHRVELLVGSYSHVLSVYVIYAW